MPVSVNAELQRRNSVAGLVPWTLVDDAASATGSADPVIDQGARTSLASILASLVGVAPSPFRSLLKFEPAVGQELRVDETATDRYHGSAPDNTATSSASWSVVRFYKDGSGNIVRVRFRTAVAWDSRTLGWT